MTCGDSYEWSKTIDRLGGESLPQAEDVDDAAVQFTPNEALEMSGELNTEPLHVVAYDFGVKYYILRYLAALGCKITVVPARTSAADVQALNPDGIFLSNGPGDPAALQPIVAEIQKLFGTRPMFGICLGHQIIGEALGGSTFKLKFGHRGGNQPIKNARTSKIEIASHNHGFAVDPNSLNQSEIELTHWNINDQTLAGLRHRKLPIFSVQYHPEAGPGPHDSAYLFHEFIADMKAFRDSVNTKTTK